MSTENMSFRRPDVGMVNSTPQILVSCLIQDNIGRVTHHMSASQPHTGYLVWAEIAFTT